MNFYTIIFIIVGTLLSTPLSLLITYDRFIDEYTHNFKFIKNRAYFDIFDEFSSNQIELYQLLNRTKTFSFIESSIILLFMIITYFADGTNFMKTAINSGVFTGFMTLLVLPMLIYIVSQCYTFYINNKIHKLTISYLKNDF